MEKRIDIMLIQETKMRAEDGTLRVFGYEVLRKDRKREGSSRYSRGGGVVILIRQGMPYKEINMMSIEKGSSMELISAEIWTKDNQSIKVINIYLPPDPENDEGIEKL